MRRVLLAAALLTLGCHREAPEEAETEAPVPVHVALPRTGPLVSYLRASGSVEPAPGGEWVVTSPAPARIALLAFAIGDAVTKGAVVARFDAATLRADLASRAGELAQAQARLDNARANHARLSGLLEKGIASRHEVDDASRELRDAEAGITQATETRAAAADLAARSTAIAPFSGIVAERWHNPGDLVDANEHVLRLVDPSRLEVVAAVLVADAGRIVVGHGARAMAPGSAADGVPARVAGAPGAVDPATGTAIVRLALSGSLPVGAPVQVEIEAERIADGLLVPASALMREGEGESVFVVGADGKAHRKDIRVGLRGASEVQVLSGVAAGDSVIVAGQAELPDGARVTPEKE